MSDLDTLVDTYLGIWNETDPALRRQTIDEIWAETGVYTDPLATASGRAGFDTIVAGAQAQFSGLRFERGATFDEHHNIARFTWNLVAVAGGEPVAVGFDVACVDENGRISTVYGFIDKMPG